MDANNAGLVKYLVDSKHVFDFVDRIVDECDDVSYKLCLLPLWVLDYLAIFD